MKRFISSLTGAFGKSIKQLVTNIRTRWKWLTSKPARSDTSVAAPVSLSSKVRSATYERKKRITRQRQRTCPVMGKIGRTEQGAKEAAKRNPLQRLRAYKCEFCEDWHITHKKRKNY